MCIVIHMPITSRTPIDWAAFLSIDPGQRRPHYPQAEIPQAITHASFRAKTDIRG
jgi:hypothetical protein